jgi:mono/diheme cytochrome c family protein
MQSVRSLLQSFVLLGCACICALGVASVYYPFTFRVVDVERGSALFQRNCASCHSLVEFPGIGAGPALNSIGSSAAERVPGMSAEEYLFESIVDPARFQASPDGTMPQGIAQQFSDGELADLIAYLMQQGGTVDYRAVIQAVERIPVSQTQKMESLMLGSIERGREFFNGKGQCVSCHTLDGSPTDNLGAPSLLSIGLNSREYLERAVCQPSAQILEQYRQWSVNRGGVLVTGRRLPSDADTVLLLVAEPNSGWRIQQFSTDELEEFENGELVQPVTTSVMPTFETWREEELNTLIDYLCTLR